MLGNAATNVAFPVVTLTVAFSQLVGVGTAANFNISLGAKKQDDARQFIGILFKAQILNLCGATENSLLYSQRYLGITAFRIPFLLFSSAGSHV